MGANGEYILEPISLKSLRVFFFSFSFFEYSLQGAKYHVA